MVTLSECKGGEIADFINSGGFNITKSELPLINFLSKFKTTI